jgi:hypothetical protein
MYSVVLFFCMSIQSSPVAMRQDGKMTYLLVLVVEVFGGVDLLHERPVLAGGDEAGREDDLPACPRS